MAIDEKSPDATTPAVRGENTSGGGDGIYGVGWRGVYGFSSEFQGVSGKSEKNAGVYGESTHLHGIYGNCHNPNGGGIFGTNDKGGFGVIGTCDSGVGVAGNSNSGDGVVGTGRRGVVGFSSEFRGVDGKSIQNAGVYGESDNLHGVFGSCKNQNGGGIYGTNSNGGFGVIGVSDAGIGISGKGGKLAGLFEGDIHIQGTAVVDVDVTFPNAGDCAEDFNIAGGQPIEPGSVMVIDDEETLTLSATPYDQRVAGVISGAGKYRAAMILDKRISDENRQPIALLGKTYCKVDAKYAPIKVGDPLTTSPTPGHAMKAIDQKRAFGATIGKALQALPDGQGLIPILVCLQ